jgi:hypothetical protein
MARLRKSMLKSSPLQLAYDRISKRVTLSVVHEPDHWIELTVDQLRDLGRRISELMEWIDTFDNKTTPPQA